MRWAACLANHFRHVALFTVDGTQAAAVAIFGFEPPADAIGLSLLESTPLRWTLEAAAPIIGAGRAPGGSGIAKQLGLQQPRAFAVLPFVQDGILTGLAYVDHGSKPLPTSALREFMGPRSCFQAQDAAVSHNPSHIPVLMRHNKRPAGRLRAHLRRRHHGASDVEVPAATCTATSASCEPKAASQPEPALPAKAALADSEMAPTDSEMAPADLEMAPANPKASAAAHRQEVSLIPAPPKAAGKIAFILALALCSSTTLLLGSLLRALAPPPSWRDAPATQEVYIAPQASLAAIADTLYRAHLIGAPKLFAALARVGRVDRALRAGYYDIATGLWPWEIVRLLQRGQVQTVRLTFAEGLSLKQIAALCQSYRLFPAIEVENAARDTAMLAHYKIDSPCAEGFLFPDTYEVVRGSHAKVLIEAMIQRFFSQLESLQGAPQLSVQALYDKVILASIIERETFAAQERHKVAGVFVNRLERDLKLESCATVQYLLGAPKPRLDSADIRIDSPYNTYRYLGLPPGPIANPGLAALQAALQPEQHDLLYFVSMEDGTHRHHFSKTFAEHQKAVRSSFKSP